MDGREKLMPTAEKCSKLRRLQNQSCSAEERLKQEKTGAACSYVLRLEVTAQNTRQMTEGKESNKNECRTRGETEVIVTGGRGGAGGSAGRQRRGVGGTRRPQPRRRRRRRCGGVRGLRIAAATWSKSMTPASGRHLRSDLHKFDHVTSTDPERACDLDRRAIVLGSR